MFEKPAHNKQFIHMLAVFRKANVKPAELKSRSEAVDEAWIPRTALATFDRQGKRTLFHLVPPVHSLRLAKAWELAVVANRYRFITNEAKVFKGM